LARLTALRAGHTFQKPEQEEHEEMKDMKASEGRSGIIAPDLKGFENGLNGLERITTDRSERGPIPISQ
jgi:hypothetical protein